MPEFTSYAHGTPCWTDVTSTDLPRAVEFYRALFGWDAEVAAEPEAGGYTMFTLDGKNVAAGSPPQQEGIPSHWTTYIASDDVDATADKIREAGGTVLVDPFDVFDAGRMTIAQDPTGATFGVWQAGRAHRRRARERSRDDELERVPDAGPCGRGRASTRPSSASR